MGGWGHPDRESYSGARGSLSVSLLQERRNLDPSFPSASTATANDWHTHGTCRILTPLQVPAEVVRIGSLGLVAPG